MMLIYLSGLVKKNKSTLSLDRDIPRQNAKLIKFMKLIIPTFFCVLFFTFCAYSAPSDHPGSSTTTPTTLDQSPDSEPALEKPLSTTPTTTQIQGFTVTSDSLERDLESEQIALIGHVKVIYLNQYIEAEQIDIDLKKKQAHLKGKANIQTPTYQIGGQEIKYDYESGQALIYYGFVQSNNIRFQGSLIEKINDKEFYVTDAEYTTCSNCPATWSFDGSQIKAELGGYAYIKSSFLNVAGAPIFWLPYLVVPLKSERQSGLLTPEIGYIRNRRLVISENFFWAISRSQDMTFTFKNYELGGFKPLVEYRYVWSENSYGESHFSTIRDTVFSSDTRLNNYRQPSEKDSLYRRWAFRTYNQYELDSQNKIQLQSSLVSDLQYPKDFHEEFRNYSDPNLENRLTFSHFMDHSLISLDSSYYRNLLEANPLSTNDTSVHRLPEIHFETTYKQLDQLPIYYKFEGTYTRFDRQKKYDDMSTAANGQRFVSNLSNNPVCEHNGSKGCEYTDDGVFNENTDQIRTGQRLNIKGTLATDSYTLGDFINLFPTLSYNESQYYFPVGENRTDTRRYFQFNLNTRTKFYHVYDENYESTGLKYKNEIIPEFQYSWVPWVNHTSHPFFGGQASTEAPYSAQSTISDSDINNPGGVLFDYSDKVYDRHIISFSLLDRLVRKKQIDNSYKTLMNFRLTQSYDLYQSEYGPNKNQPLSDLSATLELDFDQIKSYTQVNYFPYVSATNTSSTLSYLNSSNQYFKIGLSSKRSEEPHQDDASAAVGFVSKYVNVLTGAIFDVSANRDSSSRLKKLSLITQLKPPGECWAVNFYRDQKVGSEAEWHLTFDFSFDGRPTKVIPPAELNIN